MSVMQTAWRTAWLAVAAVAAGCVGSGEVTPAVSGAIVGVDEQPLGPGLVMIERGKIHEGAYQYGADIGLDGRFTVDLAEGGIWGIHLFHDDYTYLPIEIEIGEHQQVVLTSMDVAWGNWLDQTGEPTWPDQPSDATLIRMPWDDNFDDNPVIDDIAMSYLDDDIMEITMDVRDPDGDLSRMVLASDTVTGAGFALNPPSPPDSLGNYPDGIYKVTVFLDDRHEPGVTEWRFILSDNLCNNSPILTRTMPPR